ncbi:MAG: hypothetical protein RSE17_02810 [Bacilli bacterium]
MKKKGYYMTITTEKKEKKGNILNVRIPASAIVGENKKSVLIGTNTITF